ncbi:hypothetical protein KC19_11G091800, partial [Ceratodon purpureus]
LRNGASSTYNLIIVLVLTTVEVPRLHASPLARGARQRSRSLAINTLRNLPLTTTELHRNIPRANTEPAHLISSPLARKARLVILPRLGALHLRLVEDRHSNPDRKPRHSHANRHQRILVELQRPHNKRPLPAPRSHSTLDEICPRLRQEGSFRGDGFGARGGDGGARAPAHERRRHGSGRSSPLLRWLWCASLGRIRGPRGDVLE